MTNTFVKKCTKGVEYIDALNPGLCRACDSGVNGIRGCSMCNTEDWGLTVTCTQCGENL